MANWLKVACSVLGLTTAFAVAGPSEVPLTVTDASTNDSYTAEVNSSDLHGWVDCVRVEFSGTANPTVDVDVVTSDGRTLLSVNNLTTDTSYGVRKTATTTAGINIANTETMIPLVADKIEASVYNANVTGVTAKVTVYIKR